MHPSSRTEDERWLDAPPFLRTPSLPVNHIDTMRLLWSFVEQSHGAVLLPPMIVATVGEKVGPIANYFASGSLV